MDSAREIGRPAQLGREISTGGTDPYRLAEDGEIAKGPFIRDGGATDQAR
jgi:hypothetical protein